MALQPPALRSLAAEALPEVSLGQRGSWPLQSEALPGDAVLPAAPGVRKQRPGVLPGVAWEQ